MEYSIPGPYPSSPTGLTEWMRSECVIDHAGSEVSYTLQVAPDGRSFTLFFRDGSSKKIQVERKSRIEYVFPSAEGTVVLCKLMNGRQRFYDVRDGHELKEEELGRINPHFYI